MQVIRLISGVFPYINPLEFRGHIHEFPALPPANYPSSEGYFWSVCPSNFHSKTSYGDDENSTSQITRTNGPVALKMKWTSGGLRYTQNFSNHTILVGPTRR